MSESSAASALGVTPSTEDDAESYGLAMRWQEAQDKCRETLRPTERDILAGFETPEQLEKDLRTREQQYSGGAFPQLVAQIFPCVSTIHQLSLVFLATMSPRPIETTLVWGILHLAIKASLASSATLAKVVHILNRIRKELALLASYAKYLNNRTELRHALVEMFVALINFWAEAVRYLRKSTAEHLILQNVTLLNKSFNLAAEEIDATVEHIHKLASFEKLSFESDRRKHADDELLAMVSMNEDSPTTFPCYETPPSNSNFLGRTEELLRMKRFLDPNVVRTDSSCVVLYGIGGVGKSALALAYVAYSKTSKMYDAIFWIGAQSSATLRASFCDMAIRLELVRPSHSGEVENNVVLFRNWLNKTTKRWLIVFDNTDDFSLLDKYLPSSRGSVVITTRYKSEAFRGRGRFERIELESLDMRQSLELFERLRLVYDPSSHPEEERFDSTHLLQDLGGLPLGVEQMAAYIGYRGYSMQQFLGKYESMAKHVLQNTVGFGGLQSVVTVWELHFDAIQGSTASTLLGVMSLIDPDLIPVDLFRREDASNMKCLQFCEDEGELEDAIDFLMKNALIKRVGDNLSLHRLVQKAFRLSSHGLYPARIQESFDAAVECLHKCFPPASYAQGHGGTQKFRKYMQHATALTMHWHKSQEKPNKLQISDKLVELIVSFTWAIYEQADVRTALQYVEIGFKACEDTSSLIYGDLCNFAGSAYFELNNIHLARQYWERALSIMEKLYGPDDLRVANIHSNMGNVLVAEGLYEEAISSYTQAEQTRLKHGDGAAYYLALTKFSVGRIHF